MRVVGVVFSVAFKCEVLLNAFFSPLSCLFFLVKESSLCYRPYQIFIMEGRRPSNFASFTAPSKIITCGSTERNGSENIRERRKNRTVEALGFPVITKYIQNYNFSEP